MEFIGISNDDFIRVIYLGFDIGVGFGKMFKIFDKFGEVRGVFIFNGDLYDRGDGEFYDLYVVGSFGGGKGIVFE